LGNSSEAKSQKICRYYLNYGFIVFPASSKGHWSHCTFAHHKCKKPFKLLRHGWYKHKTIVFLSARERLNARQEKIGAIAKEKKIAQDMLY